MDKDSIGYIHVFTWEQFQRALVYTKKYYGMDAPYFYRTLDAELEGENQPVTIHCRLMFEDFATACCSQTSPPLNIWSKYPTRRYRLYGH